MRIIAPLNVLGYLEINLYKKEKKLESGDETEEKGEGGSIRPKKTGVGLVRVGKQRFLPLP